MAPVTRALLTLALVLVARGAHGYVGNAWRFDAQGGEIVCTPCTVEVRRQSSAALVSPPRTTNMKTGAWSIPEINSNDIYCIRTKSTDLTWNVEVCNPIFVVDVPPTPTRSPTPTVTPTRTPTPTPTLTAAAGDCCTTHGSAGCSILSCETYVCGAVPQCCISSWNGICTGIAEASWQAGPSPSCGCATPTPTPTPTP
jgi:hypothetical protein